MTELCNDFQLSSHLPPLCGALDLLALVGTGKGHLSYLLIHVSLSPAAAFSGSALYLQRLKKVGFF